jgi:hypothetical protein
VNREQTMKNVLSSLFGIVLIGIFLFKVADAGAQPVDERVLVIGVHSGHGSDARLAQGLSEHLQRSGLALAQGILSAEERACEGPVCIQELATRQGARLVLNATIQKTPPNTVFITMALFDTARQAPFQETAVCEQCTQEDLIGKLSDVADRLLQTCRQARQNLLNPAPASTLPTVPLVPDTPSAGSQPLFPSGSPPSTVESAHMRKLSPRRKAIATVLGGLAAASLIGSIALAATNGQRTSLGCALFTRDAGDYCELHDTPLFATGFATTGALVVGMGFALFWKDNPTNSFVAEVR